MVGFTIKSVSEDGTFYLVKNWRKNKKMWIGSSLIKQEHLYKSEKLARNALEKLLNLMNEYAKDTFTVVYFNADAVYDLTPLTAVNHGDDWKPDYKVFQKS